jgi:hypothetical protein
MRPPRLGTALGAGVLALALTACSSGSEEPETLDLDPTPPTSPTAPETTEPASEAPPIDSGIPTSYPEVGLEFEPFPEVDGPAAEALATYVEFERGMRQLGRTATMNKLLRASSSPAMQPTLDNTVAYLRENDAHYEGTARVTVELGGGGESATVLDLCADAADLQLVTAGTPGPVNGPQRVAMRAVLTNAAGAGWTVDQYESTEETC